MLVSQLIELLEKLPAHKEVYIEASSSQSDFFAFAPVVSAEEISMDDDETTVIAILPYEIDDTMSEPNTFKSN